MTEKLEILLHTEADNDERAGEFFFTDFHVREQTEILTNLTIRIDAKAGDIDEASRDGTPAGAISALNAQHDFLNAQYNQTEAALILYLTEKHAISAE